VSSGDRESALGVELIERLLVDPGFRAEFRRDPAAACLAAGLPDLADELAGSGAAMDTLVVRESRSSLAGVVMAVAVEGMSVAEAQALMHHGVTGAAHGLKLPHGHALPRPLGHLGHGRVSGAVRHELHGQHSGSPRHAVAAPSRSATTPEPSASPPHEAAAASSPDQEHAAAPAPATAEAAAPPNPGAQPVDGGAVPAWPDQQPAPGGASVAGAADGGGAIGAADGGGAIGATGPPGDLAALLDSPRLAAPPDVRTFLTSGGADPRMVSVLDSTLANHTIGLGQVQAMSDPVHVQAVDIVAVDGQPVGPGNLAARDLVTEIAALDPSVRPSEIGTPWPIQSPGFFSDAGVGNRLHLAFEMPGTQSPPAGLNGQAPVAVTSPPPEQVAFAPAPAETPLSSVAPAPLAAATPGSGVDAALAYAHAMIGKLPESAGSNVGPQLDRFEADFGFHGAPWCGIFAGHVLEAAGLKPPHSVASVASILDLARNGDPPFLKGVLPVSEAQPGDLVTFGGTEHVAVVTKVDAAGVHTIAGNTSQSNVSETTYSPSSVTGVVRPDYAAGTPGSVPGVWDDAGMRPPADGNVDAGNTAPLAPFTVLEPRHHGTPRHTVQFLPAVQPSPGSPLYGHDPAPPMSEPAASPPVIEHIATAAAPTGGSISVSSSLLTPGQAKFAGRLAELTGLDPRVVAAWELAEESGSAAQGREAASNFNWLNIGYFDSGAGKIAFDEEFGDPISAAEQTAKFLKGDWGGASTSIRAILSTVGHSPDEQMSAIANSDWASSHYAGGANLHGTYNELGDIQIEKSGTA
jgi:hypothetical protein